MQPYIVVLGVFVVDTSFRADRPPEMGETLMGNSFALGPGGKGSNQAVAAARVGGRVHFISKLGQDLFGDMALETWDKAGVIAQITRHDDSYTGAAYVFVHEASGDNAIIICPGVAETICTGDIDAHHDLISGAAVFMTQLEQPLAAAHHALKIARKGGAVTILNPAPAADLPQGMLGLCDYLTPNETEAEALTGVAVNCVAGAIKAAEALLGAGVGAAIITLGENGALFHAGGDPVHVPAFDAGPVVETTGAGDAFNGGFAAAIARGEAPVAAVRFGCATAAISVTRPGTAPSMPDLPEVEALLAAFGAEDG